MPNSQCPFCEHSNPAAAKFCNDCGSPLHLKPCRQCDAINDGSVKFCYMCGAPFAERASDSAVAVLRAHRMAAAARGEGTSSDAGNTTSDGAPIAQQGMARRGAMASVLPVILFGAIAIGTYFVGYQNALPLREWANATWAAVSPNRETTAAPAAPETSSVKTATVPPAESPPTPVTGSAASTPPPLQAMAPVIPPPQAASPETPPPAPTGVPPAPTAKKASTSHKTAAKKATNSTAKKSHPASSKTAPKPASGQN